MARTPVSTDLLADQFVSYLFDEDKGSRHVRPVASWIGFILKAAEKVSGGTLRKEQRRQIMFDYKRHQFKVKYNHRIGGGFSRGGLEILEVLSRRGAPEGETILRVRNLSEAEDCYLRLQSRLDSLIQKRKPIPIPHDLFKKKIE
jgi:hypothetical protein